MKGQSNIIAITIMVGLAVALALGFISYVAPLVMHAHSEHNVALMISRIASDTDVGVISSLNSSWGRTVVFGVKSGGAASGVEFYVTVLGFRRELPIAAVDMVLYTMQGNVASIEPSIITGWKKIPCTTIPANKVKVYVRGDFQSLSIFGIDNVTICPLGTLKPGAEYFYRIDIAGTPAASNTTYLGLLLVRVGGDYISVVYFELR